MTWSDPYSAHSHIHSINPTYVSYPLTSGGLITYDPAAFPTKDGPMTTMDKVRLERKGARERAKIEQKYADWDAFGIERIMDRSVLRFDWQPKDVVYTYAVLRADERWWATGHSCNGLPTEDFIAWLIEKGVTPTDVEVLG